MTTNTNDHEPTKNPYEAGEEFIADETLDSSSGSNKAHTGDPDDVSDVSDQGLVDDLDENQK